MRRLAASFACLLGCQFPGAPVDPRADATPEIDAPEAESDAASPDANACVWTPAPSLFDPCVVPPPVAPPTFEPGAYLLDTDTGMLTSALGSVQLELTPVPQTDGPEIALFYFESFDLPAAAGVRATGSRALLLASDTTMTIGGRLDVTSERDQSEPAAASAFTSHCLGDRSADNESGGGGGGGLASAGGAGGTGNNQAASGGDGGGALIIGNVLLPGCPGGIGRNDNNQDFLGSQGVGGGAIALVARTSIDVGGAAAVFAGGMGGQGGPNNATGGGGGGSGGMIVLESATVSVSSTAMVLANGGGGGEGSGNSNTGDTGDDAQRMLQAARGGQGQSGSGGDGGDGFYNGTDAETANDGNDNGGGGGGGGGGVIRCENCSP